MKKWQTLEEETVFSAPPYLQVVKQAVLLPDKTVVDDFYRVHLRHFVVVVPFMSDGTVLTIRQYKHGPEQVSLTFPAGFVDEGEAPDKACRRELLEETGFKAGSLFEIGEFVDNGNQRGGVGTYFVAKDCEQVAEPNSGDLEEMQIEYHTPAEIDRAFKDGELSIIHHAGAWSMTRLLDLISK